MARANDSTTTPIKIRRADWRKLPAWLKSHVDGIPKVLSQHGGIAEFRPVQII